MKLRIALLVLLLATANLVTSAQDLNGWIDVAPAEELFVARLPTAPVVKDENASIRQLSVSGNRYTASTDGNSYIVWSLANPNLAGRFPASSEYLDACADLVWEGLFGPRRAKLPEEKTMRQRIYILVLLSSKAETGMPEVGTSSTGLISMLGLVDAAAASSNAKHFFKSFKVNQSVSGPAASDADSLSSGSQIEIGHDGQDVNGNRIFTGREVTQKVRVDSKPEPTYTESARKYGVTGTVVLRGVFSGDGQITATWLNGSSPGCRAKNKIRTRTEGWSTGINGHSA